MTLKRSSLLRRSPLRKVSSKRAKELREYAKKRKALLAKFPTCQICGVKPSTECHHKAKRGKNYLNEETFLAVCHFCHGYVHRWPSLAREKGWLL